jgi:hypothetical protein
LVTIFSENIPNCCYEHHGGGKPLLTVNHRSSVVIARSQHDCSQKIFGFFGGHRSAKISPKGLNLFGSPGIRTLKRRNTQRSITKDVPDCIKLCLDLRSFNLCQRISEIPGFDRVYGVNTESLSQLSLAEMSGFSDKSGCRFGEACDKSAVG